MSAAGEDDFGKDGHQGALIVVCAFIALCLLAVVVIAWNPKSDPDTMPAVVGQGQAYALAQLRSAGYDDIDSHDAWGRDRDSDDKEWEVCFQSPEAGSNPRNTKVELGVVLVEEACPRAMGDQGVARPMGTSDLMPDLTQPWPRTAFMVREDFGKKASLIFYDTHDEDPRTRRVEHDLGDWAVCTQDVPAGEPWRGRPLVLTVTRFGTRC